MDTCLTCPYYHEHGIKPDVIPCCRHKHAPIACFVENPSPGNPPRTLKCDGRLSRCEIPAHKQLDLS